MRRSTLIAFAALAAITACSDTSAPPPPAAPRAPTRVTTTTTPTQLDLEINSTTVALFPKGLETAAGTRWGNIKRKLDEGQRAVAISMFNELADWIIKKQGQMDGHPANETEQHATVRLVGMMAAYIYGGEPPIPLDGRGGDVGIGQIVPGLAALIVTPLGRAGVEFDIGSVLETTLVIISENTNPNFGHCQGPLQTALCQYPTFYRFEPFPYRRLQKPARFGVCHVNTGPFAPPEGIHDRFRLAHTKPTDPKDYSPNAIRPEGENIEILPLVHVGFMTCANTQYGFITPKESPLRERHWYDRGLLAVGSAIDAAGSLLTPKDAYAIDLGGGGEGWAFSDFNVVDPQSNRIDFEHFSSGEATTPKCDNGCRLTNDYEKDGLVLDFRRDGVIEGPPPVDSVILEQSSNNSDRDPSNHVVLNARIGGPGSGYYAGTIIMRFANPHSVTFLMRANSSLEISVTAYGPDGSTPISSEQIARSDPKLYSPCTDCAEFSEQLITVANEGGISRIEVNGQLVLIDNVRITPASPAPIP